MKNKLIQNIFKASSGFPNSGNFPDDFLEIWTSSGLEASGMPIIRNRNQIWKNTEEKTSSEQGKQKQKLNKKICFKT